MWFSLLHAAGISFTTYTNLQTMHAVYILHFYMTKAVGFHGPLSSYLLTISIHYPRETTYRSPEYVWIMESTFLAVWHSPARYGGIFEGFFVCLRVIHSLNRTQQIKCTEFCHKLLDIESSLNSPLSFICSKNALFRVIKFPSAKYIKTAPFWTTTQRSVIIPYRRFGTTYGSHLQGSRIQFS